MSDCYRERIVKHPRKEYRCDGCGKKLPITHKHYYISGVFEGDFFTTRVCCACKKELESGNYRDGWTNGDLRDGRRERVRNWQYARLSDCGEG